MARLLSDDDIDAIAHRLTSFSGLTAEEHKNHHEAFSIWIERQAKQAAFWEKVQQQAGGWVVISVLGGIAYAAWEGFLYLIKRGG